MLQLPYDIISAIVDEFPPNKQELKSYSLISSSFAEACQRRLYYSITIRTNLTIRNDQLHEILTCNPQLKHFIRKVCIWLCEGNRCETLPNVLLMLPSIRDLEIESYFSIQDWNFLSSGLKLGIFYLLESAETIIFGDVSEFDMSYFSRLPHLKNLIIKNVVPFPEHASSITPLLPIESTSRAAIGYLESLEMFKPSNCRSLIKLLTHPTAPLTLAHLRVFACCIFSQSDNEVTQAILNSATSLEELKIWIGLGWYSISSLRFLFLLYLY